MQIRELVTLGRFLKRIVQEKNLQNQYEQLITSINEAGQNQNPENVNINLKRLKEIHTEAENQVLSPAQSKLLEDYGAKELLGKKAIDRINDIFMQHQANPQRISSEIQQMKKKTNQLVNKANELISALEPMLVELQIDNDKVNNMDEGRLWLYFADATSINTIEELEKAAETWKQILHHFSRMPISIALQISRISSRNRVPTPSLSIGLRYFVIHTMILVLHLKVEGLSKLTSNLL